MKRLTVSTLAFLALLQTNSAQYPGWQHSGSFHVLTTPEGANLPANAVEEGFPVLLRLTKEGFGQSRLGQRVGKRGQAQAGYVRHREGHHLSHGQKVELQDPALREKRPCRAHVP